MNASIPYAKVEPENPIVWIDGMTVNEKTAWHGLGTVTGNLSSRLLIDYKIQHPDAYWEILRLLFQPGYGASLNHIKIEFGSDINSSSGTEPAIMRTTEEIPDVTRGAGFQLAADARMLNPEIGVDLLRWSEPKWVADAFARSQANGFAARYRWYKTAVDAAYDTYGLRFTHISADANETDRIDADWIVYLSQHLKAESDARYDYGKLKIVASDEVGSWKIADAMLENSALRDAVDVIGAHYTTHASANALTLHQEYGKTIWYSEGIAPTLEARLHTKSAGGGISGTNGALDVCNRIINGYVNGRMTMYEYQPAVAAYYSGAKYVPKALLQAQTPWSGHYLPDVGLVTSAHFTHFLKLGWRFVDSACYGDGKENHSISETTNNYITLTDPHTGDYSIVLCNDSAEPRTYTFCLRAMPKADAPITIWETRGVQVGEAFDAHYMQHRGTWQPVCIDEGYAYSVTVQPYTLMTITTLGRDIGMQLPQSRYADTPLSLPYWDNFSYAEGFLRMRGHAPLYTNDQGGAFEVTEYEGRPVLMQMIAAEAKSADWRYRSTPLPHTSLGDDRWMDYTAEIAVHFAHADAENFVSLGVRYLTPELDAETAENGYTLRLYPDGRYALHKNSDCMSAGRVQAFDATKWHTISLTAVGRRIAAAVDGMPCVDVTDTASYAHAGRVALGSAYARNCFADLRVRPVEYGHSFVTRVDDHDPVIHYHGNWNRQEPDHYLHFHRTRSTASAAGTFPYLTYSFFGTHIALIGATEVCQFDVYLDEQLYAQVKTEGAAPRQCFYAADVPAGHHMLKVVVRSGVFSLDAVEICET